MSDNNLKEICLRMMEEAWPVFLTTVDPTGQPQTRAMFNLKNKERFPKLVPLFENHDNKLLVIFSTNTSSSKIGDLAKNSAVSVYYCIPDEWRGLMLGGQIEIVTDLEMKKALWHDGWEKYYPKGHDDPDHTVLRLEPMIARGWNQSSTFVLDLGEKR
ncbi:MAG: pyridoxamine 5'-phosphate oxidase family protein [Candidatus Thorarchaeota archaeon]|jgi:general stress protein 26